MLTHLMAQLHSLCGPLTGEATEGGSQVLARTAVQVGPSGSSLSVSLWCGSAYVAGSRTFRADTCSSKLPRQFLSQLC